MVEAPLQAKQQGPLRAAWLLTALILLIFAAGLALSATTSSRKAWGSWNSRWSDAAIGRRMDDGGSSSSSMVGRSDRGGGAARAGGGSAGAVVGGASGGGASGGAMQPPPPPPPPPLVVTAADLGIAARTFPVLIPRGASLRGAKGSPPFEHFRGASELRVFVRLHCVAANTSSNSSSSSSSSSAAGGSVHVKAFAALVPAGGTTVAMTGHGPFYNHPPQVAGAHLRLFVEQTDAATGFQARHALPWASLVPQEMFRVDTRLPAAQPGTARRLVLRSDFSGVKGGGNSKSISLSRWPQPTLSEPLGPHEQAQALPAAACDAAGRPAPGAAARAARELRGFVNVVTTTTPNPIPLERSAALLLTHLRYHAALGMRAELVRCSHAEAAALAAMPAVREEVLAGRVILWPYEWEQQEKEEEDEEEEGEEQEEEDEEEGDDGNEQLLQLRRAATTAANASGGGDDDAYRRAWLEARDRGRARAAVYRKHRRHARRSTTKPKKAVWPWLYQILHNQLAQLAAYGDADEEEGGGGKGGASLTLMDLDEYLLLPPPPPPTTAATTMTTTTTPTTMTTVPTTMTNATSPAAAAAAAAAAATTAQPAPLSTLSTALCASAHSGRSGRSGGDWQQLLPLLAPGSATGRAPAWTLERFVALAECGGHLNATGDQADCWTRLLAGGGGGGGGGGSGDDSGGGDDGGGGALHVQPCACTAGKPVVFRPRRVSSAVIHRAFPLAGGAPLTVDPGCAALLHVFGLVRPWPSDYPTEQLLGRGKRGEPPAPPWVRVQLLPGGAAGGDGGGISNDGDDHRDGGGGVSAAMIGRLQAALAGKVLFDSRACDAVMGPGARHKNELTLGCRPYGSKVKV